MVTRCFGAFQKTLNYNLAALEVKKGQTLRFRPKSDFPACRTVELKVSLVISFNPSIRQWRPRKEKGLAQRTAYLRHYHTLARTSFLGLQTVRWRKLRSWKGSVVGLMLFLQS